MKFSCKHVSLKLSESLDHKLSFTERLIIKVHLVMCHSCQEFAQQLKLISASTQNILCQPETLSADARQRIFNNINKK